MRADRAALTSARERPRASVVGRTWDVIVDQLLAHYARAIAGRRIDAPVVSLKPDRLARLRRSAS